MRAILALTATLLLLVCSTAGLKIGFTEVDYKTTEPEGTLNVVLVKDGENVGPLSFILTPLTYEEFNNLGFSLPESKPLPDAAEFQPSGIKDFSKATQTVTFTPSANSELRELSFSVTDDEIHEVTEGFLIVLEVDKTTAHPQDLLDLQMTINVTLGVIGNDDLNAAFDPAALSLGFEMPTYTVREDAGVLDNFIFVVKEPAGVQTELDISVNLVLVTGSSAEEGTDFEAGDTPRMLTFKPEQQRLAVPISLVNDSVFEESEDFKFLLSIPEGAPSYELGTFPSTTVTIIDDDVAVVGFEQPKYTVREGDGSAEVCVRIFQPDRIEGLVIAAISTNSITAVDADYTSINDLVILSAQPDEQLRRCFEIPITDDDDIESTEQLNVTLTRDSSTSKNVILQPNMTVICIRDNDRANTDINECSLGTHNCDSNAQCTDTTEGFVCTCNPGYTGDGSSCTDINECARSTHNCHQQARCKNTAGGFRCICRNGYTGNGVSCNDINECARSTHNCHPHARCENTAGGFKCRCRNGFAGNGVSCSDINECARSTHNCHPHARCENTVGGFRCKCRNGFAGNGVSCSDLNECTRSTHNCHQNAVCQNTNGGFKCSCNKGYVGNGIHCTDVNECKSSKNNCNRNALCVNTAGSFRCICKPGFLGNGVTCRPAFSDPVNERTRSGSRSRSTSSTTATSSRSDSSTRSASSRSDSSTRSTSRRSNSSTRSTSNRSDSSTRATSRRSDSSTRSTSSRSNSNSRSRSGTRSKSTERRG